MRVVVYGAGAVGGVVGARLFQAGHDVVLIARGPHHDAIASSGLQLDSPDGTVRLPIPVMERPGEVTWRPGDVVVLAVKSQDTASAMVALSAAAPVDTPVVAMQNGVSNEQTILRFFDSVYGCCVMLPTLHLEPGIVVATCAPTTGILDLGRYPDGVDDTAREIAATLTSATFVCEPRPDIMRWKYRKTVMNLVNAVQALCGAVHDPNPVIAMLEAEAEACFAAAGIDPVSEEDDRIRRGDILQRQSVPGRPRGGGSSWQSLMRGAGSIEADYLNGEIAVLGRLYDVPTPVNRLVQRLAAQAAREHRPPGWLSERELDRLLASDVTE